MAEAVLICLITAGSGIIASIVLKILEHMLGKSKAKADQDSGIRSELRLDLDRLRKELADSKLEIDTLEKEVDDWKIKYFQLLAQSVTNAPP